MSEGEDRRSVIDGVCVRTSVSAMQKASGCLRQWYYRYVQGLPDKPPSKGQRRGIEGHERIEHYLTTGEDVLGPLERLGVERGYIPTEKPLGVEVAFGPGMDAMGIPMVGKIDMVQKDHEIVVLTDWKFKKNVTEWGAEPEDLINPENDAGIQMLGYAEWARRTHEDAWLIDVRHVTFQTEGRREVVETKGPRKMMNDEVADLWNRVEERIVPGMKHAAALPNAQLVEKNEDICGKFGGCPYIGTCQDKMARLVAGFKKAKPVAQQERNKPMGMLSSMKSGAVTPRMPIKDEPASSEDQTRFDALMAKAEAEKAAARAARAAAKELPQVLPPDAPKSEPEKFSKPEAPTVVAKPEVPPVAKTEAPTVVAKPEVQPVVSPSVPQTAPQMVAALEASVAAAEPPKKEKAKKEKVKEPSAPEVHVKGFNLYIGCTPMGVQAQTLTAYVDKLDKMLCEAAQLNCADIRTTMSQDFSFGKWRGYLAKLALEELPPVGHYVVLPGDERVEVVANALIAKADLVVLGK